MRGKKVTGRWWVSWFSVSPFRSFPFPLFHSLIHVFLFNSLSLLIFFFFFWQKQHFLYLFTVFKNFSSHFFSSLSLPYFCKSWSSFRGHKYWLGISTGGGYTHLAAWAIAQTRKWRNNSLQIRPSTGVLKFMKIFFIKILNKKTKISRKFETLSYSTCSSFGEEKITDESQTPRASYIIWYFLFRRFCNFDRKKNK